MTDGERDAKLHTPAAARLLDDAVEVEVQVPGGHELALPAGVCVDHVNEVGVRLVESGRRGDGGEERQRRVQTLTGATCKPPAYRRVGNSQHN